MYEKGLGVEQNYSEALKLYKQAAVLGNITAQNNVAVMYRNGYGTDKDIDEAIIWYERSAKTKNLTALEELGDIYLYQKRNYEKSRYYYENALLNGSKKVQLNLGYLYQHGYGGEQNCEKALNLYRLSADEYSNKTAQCNLGILYLYGTCVIKDYSQAVYWFYKSANQGYAEGQYYLGWMYRNGYGVNKGLFRSFKMVSKVCCARICRRTS